MLIDSPSRHEAAPTLAHVEPLYGAELGAGALVGGQYVVEETRSRGGFGVVYRARALDGRPIALKVLHASLAESTPVVQRFEQEATAVRRIRHAGIVEILDFGYLTDGRPYLAMEWVDGETLEEALHARGRLSPRAALEVVEGLADALAAAHAAGIVHRDLKGSNVILVAGASDALTVKLLDFGIAKLLDGDSNLTGTASRLGTPSFMAPEQILGWAVGPATDVYALGVLMFQMLTGRLPFEGESAVEIESKHLDAPPPRASQLTTVPAGMDRAIARCLAKTPAHRYQTVTELVGDIRSAIDAKDGDPCAFALSTGAGIAIHARRRSQSEVPDADERAALERACRACAAEGLAVVTAGDGELVAATPLPQGRAERDVRLRVLRLALALAPLAVTVQAAPVTVLVVEGVPQLVAGELLAYERWSVRDASQLVAHPAAVAGLQAQLELDGGEPNGLWRVRAVL